MLTSSLMVSFLFFMEPVAGIEPATASLRMKCSAIEPHRLINFTTEILYYIAVMISSVIFRIFYCIQFNQKLAGLSIFSMVI